MAGAGGSSGGGGGSKAYAVALLARQLKELTEKPPDLVAGVGAKEDNIFEWDVTIMGPPGTPYEGGLFEAKLTFPDDFPNSPPVMRFTSELWHPNVYSDGKVCISILHSPGTDQFNELETAEERWRPILSIEAVLLSVISLFSDPNDSSPANIDAAKEWRENRKAFNRRARRCAAKTIEGEEE